MTAVPVPRKGVRADPVEEFYAKMLDVLDGHNPRLTPREARWLAAFRVTASRFDRLTQDESFAISFRVLGRCYYEKQTAGNYEYVLRACENAHRNYCRWYRQGKCRRLPADVADRADWRRVTLRLHVTEAVEVLSRLHAEEGRVLRLKLAGHTLHEIADSLGVHKRQAVRILQRAKDRLRRILGDDHVI